jgi:hypothetical protein
MLCVCVAVTAGSAEDGSSLGASCVLRGDAAGAPDALSRARALVQARDVAPAIAAYKQVRPRQAGIVMLTYISSSPHTSRSVPVKPVI